MSRVRVRFAPSPTGELHIGGARTALYNWLFARNQKGKYILRIEDTDPERSQKVFTDQIIEALSWLGIEWDEGPFFQSQRTLLYREAVERLLKEEKAYKCFCSEERLEMLRTRAKNSSEPLVYDRHCLGLTKSEIESHEKNNTPYTVRFKVESGEAVEVPDLIYGKVQIERNTIGDFVIQRSDGTHTYHLTVVVDDGDMEITHVIRGDDHLPNTPKHILLYKALEKRVPTFAHVPLILGPDKKRLSKRHGAASLLELRDEGFLPEPTRNFLTLLGWSFDSEREIFSTKELIDSFSLERISRAAAIFDKGKLLWMNGMHIRTAPVGEIIEMVKESLRRSGYPVDSYDRIWVEGIISLEIERCKTIREFEYHLLYFLRDDLEYDEKGVRKLFKKEDVQRNIEAVRECLAALDDFSLSSLERSLRGFAERYSLSFGKLVHPLRLALTGLTASPGIFEVIHFLGKEKTLERIDKALDFISDCRKSGGAQS